VLLPQPDSPTKAKVVPRAMSKLTPSTARSNCLGLPSSTRLSHGGETSKVRAKSVARTSMLEEVSEEFTIEFIAVYALFYFFSLYFYFK
jgi:hypothetical protein